MITYPTSSNLCKKSSLQCYRLYNFHLSKAATGGVLLEKVLLEISQENTYGSLFFDKLAGWGDCFWSFSCLVLKISCLFHFNRKMRWKKGIPWWNPNIYLFTRVSICLTSKISKEISQMVIWSESVFKKKFIVAIFMVRGISLGKSFWVVNTWRAPVWKWLKRSTLNFASTFLTYCCTKSYPRFS